MFRHTSCTSCIVLCSINSIWYNDQCAVGSHSKCPTRMGPERGWITETGGIKEGSTCIHVLTPLTKKGDPKASVLSSNHPFLFLRESLILRHPLILYNQQYNSCSNKDQTRTFPIICSMRVASKVPAGTSKGSARTIPLWSAK